ncbi:MAG TPA: TIGR02450 family Trp-rich protein [Candidatus Sulfomarinibacteraceae bacterium]|nr:TIGR02450 family Trp-rich protein [Candidatus Sulfomarinibacteraceae bacterium]
MTAPSPNPVNLKKLPGSKWTAVAPVNREKHFLVLDWVRDEAGEPTDRVVIEAILTNRLQEICWRALGDPGRWQVGWR